MIACIDCDLSSKVGLELSFLDTARSVVIQELRETVDTLGMTRIDVKSDLYLILR